MDLLLAIREYIDKLIEFNYYPKSKKPSLGKLEKMADLCMAGKIRKLTRYIPNDAPTEQLNVLKGLISKIKEIVDYENKNN